MMEDFSACGLLSFLPIAQAKGTQKGTEMAHFDPAANKDLASNTSPNLQSSVDVQPPIGETPPQLLAQEAAEGRRGAAWRLLHQIMEGDPRAIAAVTSLDDDRLAQHLLEFIALGTWSGKPFVAPLSVRTP